MEWEAFSVMANMQVCDIIVSEFELQLLYYVSN